MADSIQIKRGLKESLPTLAVGELGYCSDTQELYIGTLLANQLIGKVSWRTDIETLQANITNLESRVTALEQANVPETT